MTTEESPPRTDESPPRTDSTGRTLEQRRADDPRRHTHGMHNWPDWINLVLGIWLFFVPTIGIGELTAVAATSHYAAGTLISLISIFALVHPRRWQEWANLLVGIWVFLAPFLLGFWDLAWPLWNHVIVGVGVIGLSAWGLVQQQRLLRHAR